jgi:hypothetical protein
MSKSLWSLVLLVGCTEYGLGSKPDVDETSETDEEDRETEIDACSPDPVDGFDAPFNEDCYIEVATGTFTPVIKWDRPHFPGPAGDEVMSAPIVVQVTDDDGDGDIDTEDTPDVLFVSYGSEGILRAVDGATGEQHWAVTGHGLQPQGGVAAGDIDGDGVVELISLTYSGAVAFEHDGAVKWSRNNLAGHINGISDVASISDMDHDGNPEIIAGRAILNAEDGTLQGAGQFGYGGVANANVGSCSFAVDIDQDGVEEVITGNAAYNPDGSTKWRNNQLDGYPAVADFDGDGLGEVAVIGQGELRLLDTDGSFLGAVPIPGAGSTYYGGPPTIADFDGDGEPEIGVAAGSRYSVIEPDGTILWQAITDDASSGNTGSAVFDFEGDGAAEVVYADQTRLWVFNGGDGSVKLESTAHTNGTWLEYPVIADIDGDDHVEIVVANTNYFSYYGTGSSKTGITVFGDADNSWQPGRKIWNQYAYFITNVNDDGTIPTHAEANWLEHNNFRSGDLGAADGLKSPDLKPAADLCEVECSEGTVLVHVLAGNEGQSDVVAGQDPTIELFAVEDGEERFLTSRVLDVDVEAGRYLDSVIFEIEDEDPEDWDSLVVRLSSTAPECDPDNNDIEIPGPFCD